MASNQNAANPNEDIVDTIAQYDLDEDFPDYANEQNKELNQIVSIHFCFFLLFLIIHFSLLIFIFQIFF